MFIELIRLGKDAELKQAGQTEILSLYAAYDVGFGDKKKAQWIGLTMFGKRAAQVAHMMTKGTLIMATMDEIHVEEYNGKSYLKAKLVEFKFAGGKKSDGQDSEPAPRQQRAAPQPAPVDDFDDGSDIPF
jgi:single-stranded DNA-binding protein